MKKKQRILLVSMTNFFGGGEVYLLNLMKLLRSRYSITLLTASKQLYDDAQNTEERVFEPRQQYINYPTYTVRVYRLIKQKKIDLVILNGLRETFMAPILRHTGIRVIGLRHTELHSLGNRIVTTLKNKLYLSAANRLNTLICVSRVVYEDLKQKGLTNLQHIPNWADEKFYAAVWHPRHDGLFHIVMVSRLEKRKGHLDLFEAIRGIEGVVLHLVGDGPDESLYRAQSKGLTVFFHGYQHETIPFYQHSHLLVAPSYSEGGNPLCILEAMAVGLPCIASDIPSHSEVLDGNALFRLGDIADMRSKIKARMALGNALKGDKVKPVTQYEKYCRLLDSNE